LHRAITRYLGILAVLLIFEKSFAQKIPAPKGRVNDFEHLLTSREEQTLDSLLALFEKQTTNQLALVTLDSNYTSATAFDDFIISLHNAWGVGLKGKNNGIVVGISAQLRSIRISNGQGILARLSDAETLQIIDQIMIPEFKKGAFFTGIRNGLMAIIAKLQ
jgi:uncharacterized protein